MLNLNIMTSRKPFKSYKNLLGTVGDCENKALFSSIGSAVLTDYTAEKQYGTQSIKVAHNANNVGGFFYVVTSLISSSKYYLISGWTKTSGGASIGSEIKLLDNAFALIKTTTATKSTSWVRVGAIITPSNFVGKNLATIRFTCTDNDSNQTALTYFDGLMLQEITEAESSLTVAQLLAKYPTKFT